MQIGFPTNTVILTLIITLITFVAFWLILTEGLKRLSLNRSTQFVWRWGSAAVLAVFLLARLSLNGNENFAQVANASIVFLIVGLIVGTLPLMVSSSFRQMIRAIPESWLVGIHALRVEGFVFLALLDMKLLPPQFALPAGIGDMTVGVLAIGAIYAFSRQKAYARSATLLVTLLGLLDFISALTTGALYVGPFVTPLAEAGISTLYMNYVFLIPSVVVSLLALLHIYTLFQRLSPQTEANSGVQLDKEPVFPAERSSARSA